MCRLCQINSWWQFHRCRRHRQRVQHCAGPCQVRLLLGCDPRRPGQHGRRPGRDRGARPVGSLAYGSPGRARLPGTPCINRPDLSAALGLQSGAVLRALVTQMPDLTTWQAALDRLRRRQPAGLPVAARGKALGVSRGMPRQGQPLPGETAGLLQRRRSPPVIMDRSGHLTVHYRCVSAATAHVAISLTRAEPEVRVSAVTCQRPGRDCPGWPGSICRSAGQMILPARVGCSVGAGLAG